MITLRFRIREIPGSNLGPQISYPEVFLISFTAARQTTGLYLELCHARLRPCPSHVIILLIRQDVVQCVTLRPTMNK